MGGEGSDETKRKAQKMMTEFNLLQKVAEKEVRQQQPQRGQRPPGSQSKREQELEKYVGALQAQCQQDVYQLMSIIQQLGGFKQKQLIPFFKNIKARYKI